VALCFPFFGALNDAITNKNTIPFTYSQNSYITQADANISCISVGHLAIVRCNINITSLPTGQVDKVIGTLGSTFVNNAYSIIPSQSGKGSIIFLVTNTGQVQISNLSGQEAKGFYRMMIPIFI